MAVVVQSTGNGQTGNLSSFSFSHTISGSDRHVIVVVGTSGANASSVTVGSTTCSLIAGSRLTEGSHQIELWETDSEPATGAQTVAGSLSAMGHSAVNSINLTDVNQTTATDDLQTDQSAAASALTNTHTLHSDDSLIIAGVRVPQAVTEGTNETQEYQQSQAGNVTWIGSQSGADGGVINPSWSSDECVMSSVNVRKEPKPFTANVPLGTQSYQGFIPELKNGASWKADQNIDLVAIDVTADVDLRLRTQIKLTGGADIGPSFKYQYRKNLGTWLDITAASSNVQTNATTHFADGDDCLEKLLGGADEFIDNNDAAEDTSGTFTMPLTFHIGNVIESELSFTLVSADLAGGDDLDFRIVEGDATVFTTYTQTPSIAVTKGAGAGIFRPPLRPYQHNLMR